jgi:hypothetical protein
LPPTVEYENVDVREFTSDPGAGPPVIAVSTIVNGRCMAALAWPEGSKACTVTECPPSERLL